MAYLKGMRIFTWAYIGMMVIDIGFGQAAKIEKGVALIGEVEQKLLIQTSHLDCLTRMISDPPPDIQGPYCNRTWDNLLCWPDTPAGTVANLSCPHYNCFWTNASATRACLPDGTWYVNPSFNNTWTNYSACMASRSPLAHPEGLSVFAEHMGRITLMYNIGYWLSFISLFVAVIIMLAFKKLHCPRNTVHVNLFMSFILRAFICLLKDNLLVNGVGLEDDLVEDDCGNTRFRDDDSHWQCRLLLTLFNYVTVANYTWIFVEGLFLNMLIFVSVFSEKRSIYGYIIAGWAFPLASIIPWVVVRILYENLYCWNTHPTPGFFWIIKGPILATIAINFFFFLNIVRVLLTKLKAPNTAEARKYRYIKLAKSTLVLIPLFGVHYIIFAGLPDNVNEHVEIASLYFEMFFNSFQGLLVAILFCFCNGEVQAEIKKKWHRFRLRHGSFTTSQNSKWNTMTSYVPRMRTSNHSIQDTNKVTNNGAEGLHSGNNSGNNSVGEARARGNNGFVDGMGVTTVETLDVPTMRSASKVNGTHLTLVDADDVTCHCVGEEEEDDGGLLSDARQGLVEGEERPEVSPIRVVYSKQQESKI